MPKLAIESLPDDITEWIGGVAGAVSAARRLPGGNRKQAWAVDAGGQALFLRRETAHDPNDPYDLTREAGWYRMLDGQGVAIPSMIGFSPELGAMLVVRAPGQSAYLSVPDPEIRQAIALDLMEKLAALHAVDTMGADPHQPVTIRDAIAIELDLWEAQYRATGRLDPLIELALVWLRGHLPDDGTRPGLVHGDAGPGNFLHLDGHVTALVDWELAHFGDPQEDLAWLSMRTVLEPFPDFAACIAHYAKVSGRTVDLDRIRYFRVLVQLRVAVIRWIGEGQVAANSLISSVLNRRLLTVALAEAEGLPLPSAPDVAPPSADDGLARDALDELRLHVIPALTDASAIQYGKSLARLVKRLRDGPRYAMLRDREVRAALTDMLGGEAGTDDLACAIRNGTVPVARILPLLSRLAGYDTRMAEDAMGALAWRGFPDLERTSG